MGDDITEKSALTDSVKAAVINLGIVPKFMSMHTHKENDVDLDTLKTKAASMIGELEGKLDSGKLGDTDSQKLNAILARLRGALQSGTISYAALLTALSEATTIIGAADSTNKNESMQQKIEQLWLKIDA